MRAFLLALFALFACSPTPQPAPMPADAAISCSAVAAHVVGVENGACTDAHGVPYAKPLPTGETFAQTLCNAVDAGAHVPLACLAAAHSCAEVKACR